MPITPTQKIWMDGELVNWDDAQIHILNPTLHYGWGVFEGVRAYATDRGPSVFRLTEHINRLFRSPHLYLMQPSWTPPHLAAWAPPAAGRGAQGAGPGQRGRRVLHPPAALPRLRRDGAQPAPEQDRRLD